MLVLGSIILLTGTCSRPARPNVIVFLVDMLRPDHLGLYGYSKDTSPNLDRLAGEGVVFDRAFAPAPWTLPSTVSLLTGLHPSEHGADEPLMEDGTRAIAFPSAEGLWLTADFREAGYRTVAFHSHRYLHRSVSDIHTAFEEYHYAPERFVETTDFSAGTSHWTDHMYADTLYPQAEEWLRESAGAGPFFMYLHLIDVHGPYNRLRLLPEDEEKVRRGIARGEIELPRMDGVDMYAPTDREDPHKSYLYDGHIRETDRYLGRLQELLDELGIAEDTWLVFTSDHGEGFGEHGYWGHGRYVYNDQTRVPLVLMSHATAREHSRRIGRVVNTVGLLPTLARLAGIPVGDDVGRRGFDGLVTDSAPASALRLSYSETSRRGGRDALILGDRYKLITEWDDGERHLYDLIDDPAELEPLDPSAGSTDTRDARDLLPRLVDLRAALRAAMEEHEASLRQLSPEAIKTLEELGYIR